MLQMYGPHYKCALVSGGPRICSKMQAAGIVLQHLLDMISAHLEGCLDVSCNGLMTWYTEMGSPSSQQLQQFAITNNAGWLAILRDPLDNMGTDKDGEKGTRCDERK